MNVLTDRNRRFEIAGLHNNINYCMDLKSDIVRNFFRLFEKQSHSVENEKFTLTIQEKISSNQVLSNFYSSKHVAFTKFLLCESKLL